MADRYLVTPLSGSPVWSNTACWSDTSGGAGGFSVPISVDDVYMDGSSPNCDLDIAGSGGALSMVGYTNLFHLLSGMSLVIEAGGRFRGSVTLESGSKITINNSTTSGSSFDYCTFTELPGSLGVEAPHMGNFSASAISFSSLTIGGNIGWVGFAPTTIINFTLNPGTTFSGDGMGMGFGITATNINWVGTSGSPITLNRSGGSNAWPLIVTGSQSISYVTASWVDASGGNQIQANNGTNTDGGNNTNWNFTPPSTTTTINPYATSTSTSTSTTTTTINPYATSTSTSTSTFTTTTINPYATSTSTTLTTTSTTLTTTSTTSSTTLTTTSTTLTTTTSSTSTSTSTTLTSTTVSTSTSTSTTLTTTTAYVKPVLRRRYVRPDASNFGVPALSNPARR